MFISQADRKDPQGNGFMSGFEVLLQKQLKGKQMQKEMAEFIRERFLSFPSGFFVIFLSDHGGSREVVNAYLDHKGSGAAHKLY